jgi:hypothetical protein
MRKSALPEFAHFFRIVAARADQAIRFQPVDDYLIGVEM